MSINPKSAEAAVKAASIASKIIADVAPIISESLVDSYEKDHKDARKKNKS